jgi:translation initiation factor IF-3
MAYHKSNAERVNEGIRVSEVRLIDESGNLIGVIPTGQAIEMAYSRGLDLVEVQANSRPPVCRIMDYGKFKYDKSKKSRISRKKQHTQSLKEMRFSAKISDHDYNYKKNHVRDFLLNKDKVKISIRFRGREINHVEMGQVVMERIKVDIDDIANVEQQSKLEGKQMTMMLAPDSKKIAIYLTKQKKKASEKNELEKEQDQNQ